MSTYETFAIVGLGRLGIDIARGILEVKRSKRPEVNVKLIIRHESLSSGEANTLEADGAEVHKVDYSRPATILAALEGVDVLVSTIGYYGLSAQDALADLAKTSGVRLFVPSEFGARSDAMADEAFAIKERFRQKLIANGVNYAVFYSGFWADFDLRPMILSGWFGMDFKNRKIDKWTSWDVPLSFTTQRDVARFVVHVLTMLSPDQLENRIFRIEGDRQTWNSLFSAFLDRSGEKWRDMDVIYRTRAELDAKLENEPGDVGKRLLRAAEDGMFCVEVDGAGLDNEVFPSWNAEKALDVMIASFA